MSTAARETKQKEQKLKNTQNVFACVYSISYQNFRLTYVLSSSVRG